jgi:hypothetical protein
MIIVDPEIGDYEIGANEIEASRRLQRRHPGSRLYGLRVGYKSRSPSAVEWNASPK